MLPVPVSLSRPKPGAPPSPRVLPSPRSSTAGRPTPLGFSSTRALIHKQITALDARKLLETAYFHKHDNVSRDFLDSVENLANREFERAAMEDEAKKANNMMHNNVCVSSAPEIPRSRSRSRPAGPRVSVDGYKFFGGTLSPRPSTAPHPVVPKKTPEKSRPGSAVTSSSANTNNAPVLQRALTRTKIISTPPPSRGKFECSRVASSEASGDSDCPERPDSAASSCSSKRVTFAADVVNYEREAKPPKRRKMPKRRKPGFPHPSRGIFIPPESEIIGCGGPSSITCRDNPYLSFTQVWTHPGARNIQENNTALIVRRERFHRVMTDLEHAHHHYNRLTQEDQDVYLIHCIFKRYVLALDLALTEANFPQIEHILETIENSSKVLQRSMHSLFFDLNGLPKESFSVQPEKIEHPDLVLITYALGRISGDLPRYQHFQDMNTMCIETILVKLCLEMMALVFASVSTPLFRICLAAVPSSSHQAVLLLKDLMNQNDSMACYIKWINNSAVQRDFRSILKNFELLDRYGCKSDVPDVELPSLKRRGSVRITGNKRRTPSAPGIRRPRSSSH